MGIPASVQTPSLEAAPVLSHHGRQDVDVLALGRQSPKGRAHEEAKWVRLNKITYKDPTGGERQWEMAERQTRRTHTDTDGVGVIAILNDTKWPRSGGPCWIRSRREVRP